MKKLVLLILLSILQTSSFQTVYADGDCLVKIEAPSIVETNDEIDVKAVIENNPGVAAWTISVRFDSEIFDLVNDSITEGNAFKSGNMLLKYNDANKVTGTWFSLKNNKEDGEMFSFKLKVKNNVNEQSSELNVFINDNDIINIDEENVMFTTSNKTVKVRNKKNKNDNTIITINSLNETKEIELSNYPENSIIISSNHEVVNVVDGVIKPIKEGTASISIHDKEGKEIERYDIVVKNKTKTNINNKILILSGLTIILIVLICLVVRMRKHNEKSL